MKSALPLGALIWFATGPSVDAQPFDPTQLNAPRQFYTNGVQIDTWNRDEARGQIVTLWFGKNPKNSLSYRQLIAIRRDNDPGKILYFDLVGRKFVGRYDMALGKYSLLEPQHRLERLEDIQEDWFPPPGEKPSIGELFDRPDDGLPNDEQLMMPPVTMMFPRLEKSTWKGFYADTRSHRRRKMTLSLDGQRGRFQAPAVNIDGKLYNVQYEIRDEMHVIRGNWSVANTGGGFEYRIMMMNLNEFQGEYWVGNNRRQLFLWDGRRTSR